MTEQSRAMASGSGGAAKGSFEISGSLLQSTVSVGEDTDDPGSVRTAFFSSSSPQDRNLLFMRLLIVGCGYVGTALGKSWADQGHAVWGVRRGAVNPSIKDTGITPIEADITDLASLQRIDGSFDAVINLVSSGRGGAEQYRQSYLEGSRNLLRWSQERSVPHIIYSSSTSVYGQTDGSWVNEETPVNPKTETGKILVETEQLYFQCPVPATVLRVAGIYGPGRGHLFHQFLSGDARIHGSGDRWINMIHLDDLVGSIQSVVTSGRPHRILNVGDNEPVTEASFFRWLSEHLKRPFPPQANPEELGRRKRGFSSKRVSNKKLREELGYVLKFPTFREGYSVFPN